MKSTTHKRVLVALSLALLLVLAACGGNGGSTSGSTSTAQETTSEASQASAEASQSAESTDDVKKVSIVLPMDHTAMNAVKDGVTKVVKDKYGDKVQVDVKNANGDSSLLNSILQDVVSDKPDVIVPIATGPTQIAASTTKDIPILFGAVTDPVATGLVKSWEEPGGNVTGVSDGVDVGKIIDFALQLKPEIKTFGILYTSSEENSRVQAEDMKKTLESKNLAYEEATITGTSDLQQVAENLATKVDAILTPSDNNVASAMPTLIQVTSRHKLMVLPAASTMVEDGGTATVGLSYDDLGLQLGEMVVRVLEGKTVAETPAEKVAKQSPVLNEDAVEALGLTVSEELLKDVTLVKTKAQ